MKLTPDNAIALIVDLQEKLVPAMDDAPRLVARSKYLLEGLSVLQIPVVQKRQYPKGLGDTLAEIQEAAPSAKYFDKTTFGCLETKEIRDFFVADSRPNVLLAGIETHICVLQTALELLELGKRVYLIADCSTSRSPFDAQIAQERAFQAGVVPATAEAILFETTRDAGSPYFKAISKLTKELK